VRVVSENDVVIGMGLSNYSSGDLKKVLGKHSDELEELMGASCYTEAIHRDNLLMDAVV
jgi:glutamate 5-kinase